MQVIVLVRCFKTTLLNHCTFNLYKKDSLLNFRETQLETIGDALPLRNLETASPPAAMTSQNYLQLLHEKSDSFPSNLASYANTHSIQSDIGHQALSNSKTKTMPYLNKEETYQDLPTLPQKMIIRSKTENSMKNGRINQGLPLPTNNNFETSSEPHVNSEHLNGKSTNNHLCTTAQTMDSRRSS